MASIDLTSEDDDGLEDILLLMGVLLGRTDLNFPIDGRESAEPPEDRECGDMMALASISSINSGSEADNVLEDILLLVGVLLLLVRTDLNFPIDDGSESAEPLT